MRFAMVTTFYPPYSFGGDGTYVRALSRLLATMGHEVDVVHCADAFELLNHGPPIATAAHDPGVRVHSLRSGLGALSPLVTQQTGQPGVKAEALRRILNQDFDIIHYHNISLVGGPGVLRLGRARAKLYTLHEHWLLCPTHILWKNRSRGCDKQTCFSCSLRSGIPPQLWRYTRLRDAALEHVDRLISPSEYTAARHRAAGIARPIEVLPMFSALEQSSAAPEPSSVAPYFLYVGRVTASKGIHLLIREVAGIPTINLLVAGSGDMRAALMREYGPAANITFLDAMPQERLAGLYAGARALVLPSLAPETFGLTVVEAASFGVPAIVSQSAGGAREFVLASGGGAVYATQAELGATLARLAAQPDYASELGRRARAAYFQSYTREAHIAGYMRCVEEALRARRIT